MEQAGVKAMSHLSFVMCETVKVIHYEVTVSYPSSHCREILTGSH